MKRVYVYLVLILSLGLLLWACGGGGGGGGFAPAGGSPGTDGDTTTDPTPTAGGPAFGGYDFSLTTGSFWEFRWDYYENSWAQGSSPSTTADSGRFWVVLGQPVQIQGITSYEVKIYGKSRNADRTFSPRWKYLAVDHNQILGSSDGVSFATVFDAETGKWPGGGFFTEFPSSTLNIAKTGTISAYNTYVTGTAVIAQRSASQSQCQYFPGIGTICGDSSYNYREEEYYRADIGPVGYYYYNTYSSCGGNFCSGATWRHNLGLTASSFTGQANPLINESEPNDSPARAQAITSAHPIISTAAASVIANSGNTVINVTITDDNGYTQAITPTVEDWYTFSLLATKPVTTITLSFEGSPTADLDLYLMNSTGTTALGYSVHDNPARKDQHEIVVVKNLPAGTYRIGVDAFLAPSGPVQYTLQLE